MTVDVLGVAEKDCRLSVLLRRGILNGERKAAVSSEETANL